MTSWMKRYRAWWEPVWAEFHRRTTAPLNLREISPIILLGNQKTGSTAVARLLALHTGSKITTNVRPAWKLEPQLVSGACSMESFLQKNRYYFRTRLIKENTLSLMAESLAESLPQARLVFLVRHPAHNIRSILDRWRLPGRPIPLTDIHLPSQTWHRVIDTRWLGQAAETQIESLARRWVLLAELYWQNRERWTLVKYEDFLAAKVRTIENLAEKVELEGSQNIQALVDFPFKAPGRHRQIPVSQFFEPEALQTIHEICGPAMERLGYGAERHSWWKIEKNSYSG